MAPPVRGDRDGMRVGPVDVRQRVRQQPGAGGPDCVDAIATERSYEPDVVLGPGTRPDQLKLCRHFFPSPYAPVWRTLRTVAYGHGQGEARITHRCRLDPGSPRRP